MPVVSITEKPFPRKPEQPARADVIQGRVMKRNSILAIGLGLSVMLAAPAGAETFNCSNLTGVAQRCKEAEGRLQYQYLSCSYRAETVFDRNSCIRKSNQKTHELHAGICGLPDFRHVVNSCATADQLEEKPNMPVASHRPGNVKWASSGPVVRLYDGHGYQVFPNQPPTVLMPQVPNVMVPVR